MGGPIWVDLHARLAPEAGGPATLAETLSHLEWAARSGFRRLFIPAAGTDAAGGGAGVPPAEDAASRAAARPARAGGTAARAAEAASRLQVAAQAMGLGLRVEPLPYLPLQASGGLAQDDVRRLCLPGTNVVPVTLPRTKELKGPARLAGMLWRSGFVPAVFQPETHPEVQRLPELIRYLLQVGALLVLDAPSILGHHGNGARLTAERLHRLGYYSMVAGYVGWPGGPVAPAAVRAALEKVTRPGWVPRKTPLDYDLLLRGRAARLAGEGARVAAPSDGPRLSAPGCRRPPEGRGLGSRNGAGRPGPAGPTSSRTSTRW